MINDKLGSQQSIIIHVGLNDDSNVGNLVTDIRDPRLMDVLIDLSKRLEREPAITGVSSLGSLFQTPPQSLEQSRATIQAVPSSSQLINRDYTSTLMFIQADIGSGQTQVRDVTNLIESHLDATPIPPGVTFTVTGNPPMETLIFSLLTSDAIRTLSIACLLILVLLFLMERSVSKSLLSSSSHCC